MRFWITILIATFITALCSLSAISGPVTPNPYVTNAVLGIATSHLITRINSKGNGVISNYTYVRRPGFSGYSARVAAKMTQESTARQAHIQSIVPAGGHPAAGSHKQVQYNDSGSFAGASQLNYSSAKFGVGTTSPDTQLTVITDSGIGGIAATRGITSGYHDNSASGALVNFRKSRGSRTSPSKSAAADSVGLFTSEGYTGTGYTQSAYFGFAVMSSSTAKGVSSGNIPQGVTFVTGTGTNITRRARMIIKPEGSILVNSPSTNPYPILARSIFDLYSGYAGRGTATFGSSSNNVAIDQNYGLTLSGNAGKIKFPSVSMPSPTDEGAVWKNQHTFYGNQYQVTRSFNMAHGIQVSDTTVGNTTTETTVYTAAQAANYPTAGKTIKIKLLGYLSKRAADTMTIRLKVGSTTLLTSTVATTGAPLTNAPLHGDFYFTYRTVGASGTCISSAAIDVNNTSIDASATATTTVDTTASNNITVTFQWSAADAGNTTTVTQGYTETLGALELKNSWYALHQDPIARREDYV